MVGSPCAVCGQEEFLPFRCKLCGEPHCQAHRLPENHSCVGLTGYRSRVRDARIQEARAERVEVRGAPWGDAVAGVRGFTSRSATNQLLVVVLGVFAAQLLGGVAWGLASGRGAGQGFADASCALALGACDPFVSPFFGLLVKPWAIVTNVVAHAGPLHLLFNCLFLYFFGQELEQRIGRRMLTTLFVGAGILAAVGQVVIFGGAVLGASGAIMGLLGTLTVLAPRMRVQFWFIPLQLWVLTIIFVLFDLGGLFSMQGNIANLAHLFGLALGLAYGLHLHRRGVMPRVTSTWASQRRY